MVVRYGVDFFRMMMDSGCVGVGLGIESGSNTILKNINKGETAEQMMEAVKMLWALVAVTVVVIMSVL